MSKSYTFKRSALVSYRDELGERLTPLILQPEKVEVGLFISDDDAARYARTYGYDTWTVSDDQDGEGLDAAILPDDPGSAFEDAFQPLLAAEGATSDIATVTDDTLVAANVIQYDVTLTLEITVPVYAADKANALKTVQDTKLSGLLGNNGRTVRRGKVEARVHV